jgi:hypothetical protein
MRERLGRAVDGLRRRLTALRRRLVRLERRELHELRVWLERETNLLHVSIVLLVPLLIAGVTWLSNTVEVVSFLLFPPLASGTYTLFAHPRGEYASPRRFVAGMTLGALCGWVALVVAAAVYGEPSGTFAVRPGAAALGVFLAGATTWALDVEVPSAFSTALLVLLVGQARLAYVVGVAVSSTLVAGAFVLWRERLYGRRSELLYTTTDRDDRVLVPIRESTTVETATFAGRLAAAHEASKVVLLSVVDDAEIDAAEAAIGDDDGAAEQVAAQSAMGSERLASRVETTTGVPCEVVVAAGDPDDARVAVETAAETNCDLIVAPHEVAGGTLTGYLRRLLAEHMDVVVFRSVTERTAWPRVLVATRGGGDNAHAMVDFAERLAGPTGEVSVCTCIDDDRQRRRAEHTLDRLVETVDGAVETRVARDSVESFLGRNAASYDLVVVGASTDRSAASRFVSRPTFERLDDLDSDVAIVHHD